MLEIRIQEILTERSNCAKIAQLVKILQAITNAAEHYAQGLPEIA